MSAAELERDPSVQHVDVRLFFPAGMPPEELADNISGALQDAPGLCDLISAYRLTGGTADESPLA